MLSLQKDTMGTWEDYLGILYYASQPIKASGCENKPPDINLLLIS